MEKTYAKLGWNVKCLREAFHETEEQLAYSVGVTRQAICNYENGTRIPTRDTIVKLAQHFNITENELINGDFSGLAYPGSKIEDIDAAKAAVDIILPLVSSDTAMSNKSFKTAFTSHETIYAGLKSGIPVSDLEHEKCLQLYEEALNDGVTEAAANILWWILFWGMGYSDYEKIEGFEDLRNRRISGEEFLRQYYLQNCDDESTELTPEIIEMRRARRLYLRESEGNIQLLLQVLKRDTKYSDLADYYLALRYFRGVVYNNNSDALNRAIGEEMMVSFSLWENRYVLNFLRISQTEE